MYFISIYSERFISHSIYDEYDCYGAITSAVTKSHDLGVDVKAKLGNELIDTLNQVFILYFSEYRQDFHRRGLNYMYKDLHALLEFPLHFSTQ